jgi:hypothetical protein
VEYKSAVWADKRIVILSGHSILVFTRLCISSIYFFFEGVEHGNIRVYSRARIVNRDELLICVQEIAQTKDL